MKQHRIDQNKGDIYMLIDLHAHSSGISRCCRIPFEQVLKQTLDNGMNGIVLTNHYQKSYVEDGNLDAFVEKYIAEFLAAEQYGKEIGCRVFFGIEVTVELYPNVHMLIYGVDPEFLKKHPQLFDLTQKELYKLVKTNNGVLVQAHPFRNGTTVLDTEYMDGVEINCHPLYGKSYAEKLLCIAKDNHLIVTCGGDFHADTYRPKCGMFLPNHIKNHNDLCSYLLSPDEKNSAYKNQIALYVQQFVLNNPDVMRTPVLVSSLLHKENHRHGRWFQKALAMPSPNIAESLPLMREVAKIFDF